MTKSTEDREWAIRVVIDEITSSTGPTGGWLDSPKAICAAIVARLETVKRVAPCPICGKEVHGELREAESPRQPSTDKNKLRKIADEIQNACGDHHPLSSEYYGILAILEKHFGTREVSEHPVPAPETQTQGDNAELVRMAEKLLEWMPIYSKGSSGNIRQTNLRAAIEKFKVEHPEPAKGGTE